MKKVAVIYGSSRPSKAGEAVANYFLDNKGDVEGIDFETIDLAEVDLPFLDEPMPPMMGKYQNEHTKIWAEMIDGFDGFVFVTTTYNNGYAPILKNSIDTLYNEWTGKPAAVISYGAAPSSNGAKQLREVLEHMKFRVADASIHVSPGHEVISEDGINDEGVSGDPVEVSKQLKALLI